jgi:hypothetical protein
MTISLIQTPAMCRGFFSRSISQISRAISGGLGRRIRKIYLLFHKLARWKLTRYGLRPRKNGLNRIRFLFEKPQGKFEKTGFLSAIFAKRTLISEEIRARPMKKLATGSVH